MIAPLSTQLKRRRKSSLLTLALALFCIALGVSATHAQQDPFSGLTKILRQAATPSQQQSVTADDSDSAYIRRALNFALETTRSGTETTWKNPSTGRHGTVVPSPAFNTRTGQVCRGFERITVVETRVTNYKGTACRKANRMWIVREESLVPTTSIANVSTPAIGPYQPVPTEANKLMKETQRLLTQLGYDPGLVDGISGPKTRRAIKAYQETAGLPVDGVVSESLLEGLRSKVSASRATLVESTQPKTSTASRQAPGEAILAGKENLLSSPATKIATLACPTESKQIFPTSGVLRGYGAGFQAYLNHDYTAAFQEWNSLTLKRSLPVKHNNLGWLYERGLGVQQNYVEAVHLYRKAADKNLPLSQSHLGRLYEYGCGVAQNYSEAVKWYRKATDRKYRSHLGSGVLGNVPEAEYRLARLYELGRGVRRRMRLAAYKYGRAADQGHPAAKAAQSRVLKRLGIRRLVSRDYLIPLGTDKETGVSFWAHTNGDRGIYLCVSSHYGFPSLNTVGLVPDVSILTDKNTVRSLLKKGARIRQLACPKRTKKALGRGPFSVTLVGDPYEQKKGRPTFLKPRYIYATFVGETLQISQYFDSVLKKHMAQLKRQKQFIIKKTRLESSKRSSRKRFVMFTKTHRIKAWPAPDKLQTNPFIYEGQIVGLVTTFHTMLSATQGLFSRNLRAIVVMNTPVDMFQKKQPVVLAARVIGKTYVKIPVLGDVLIPQLEYVYAHLCKTRACDDLLLWKK